MVKNTNHNERFKAHWLSLSMNEATKARKEIMELLEWDRQKWYHVLQGRTKVKTAEQILIADLMAVPREYLFPNDAAQLALPEKGEEQP